MEKIEDYNLIKIIGKGCFGQVYLAIKDNFEKYAIKRIHISNLEKNVSKKKCIDNEINIMSQLKHENIIRLHNIFKTKEHLYLVMDYMNGGNLSKYLENYKKIYNKPFPQEMIQFFVRQIVEGLVYLHSKGIIHRDLKLDNILLNFKGINNKENMIYNHGRIKIIDFGLSTQIKKDKNILASSLVGTPIIMDPVIMLGKDNNFEKPKMYDEKCDIWSLGAITYEMLTGINLFKAKNMEELKNNVVKGNYYLKVDDLSNEMLSFLNCMLQYDPEKRLSAEELLKHQFLTGDPENFQKAEVSTISYKITDGILTVNIFNNKTIGHYFPYKPESINNLTMNITKISDSISDLSKSNQIRESGESKEEIENPIKISISNLEQTSTHIINCDIQPKSSANDSQIKLSNTNNEQSKSTKDSNYKLYPIKFEVKIIDNNEKDIGFNISLLVSENNIKNREVKLIKENNFYDEWIWFIENNDWRNVDNNNENFIITILFRENNNSAIFTKNVETIKLGKKIDFICKNNINFTLTPMKTTLKN